MIALASYAIGQGELTNKALSGVKITPTDRIALGVQLKEAGARLRKDLDPEAKIKVAGPDGKIEGESFEDRLDRLYPGRPGYMDRMRAEGRVLGEEPKGNENAD